MNKRNIPQTKDQKRSGDTFARRVVPAVVLVGASGGLLALLDKPQGGVDVAAAGPPIAASGASTSVAAASTAAPASDSTDTSVADAQTTVVNTTPAAVETTVPAAPAQATGDTSCGATVLGPSVNTKFGPVQVQASVSTSGYVCSAQGVVWPTRDRKSVNINNQAIPLLDQWAAYQHDASFNSISGATYTSRAYKESLQSIIDQVVAGG